MPTTFDRVHASYLGAKAAEVIAKEKFGFMAAIKGNELSEVPLSNVAKGPQTVPMDLHLVTTAKSVGTSFREKIEN